MMTTPSIKAQDAQTNLGGYKVSFNPLFLYEMNSFFQGNLKQKP